MNYLGRTYFSIGSRSKLFNSKIHSRFFGCILFLALVVVSVGLLLLYISIKVVSNWKSRSKVSKCICNRTICVRNEAVFQFPRDCRNLSSLLSPLARTRIERLPAEFHPSTRFAGTHFQLRGTLNQVFPAANRNSLLCKSYGNFSC